jgi:3-isopropylmalate/(R)-2-methylmalate dehydratase large subunit
MNVFLYKYLAKAAGLPKVAAGEKIEIGVDLMLAHDGTGPRLLKAWGEQAQSEMYDAQRLLLTVDHAFPAPTPEERIWQRRLADFAQTYGCLLYNHGEGVLHQIVAEQLAISPGMIVAGADGHVATIGAYGALAFALAPEELVPVLITGKLALAVPELLTIELQGQLQPGVMARDVAFYIMGRLAKAMKGKVVALTGGFTREISAAGRMALCNIIPESGAVTAVIVPKDEETGFIDYAFDVGRIEPMIALPPAATNIRPVRELRGTAINVAIAGGCSAGRLEDMEVIAAVLRENFVQQEVIFVIIPASRQVAWEMDERGLSRLFREKGAVVMPPGCGPCPGKHFGVLAPGDTAITTMVRNKPGRMGAIDAEIYLASPFTVANAAVNGQI